MKVLALVCPNGLGHFRRVVAIVSRLIELRPDLEVQLACADWQIERTRATLRLPPSWVHQVHWLTGLTEPGVQWSNHVETYHDGRLQGWEQRLATVDLPAFDLVLSDNLTGILARRPDAVLSGSFLWSEVLGAAYPADPAVADFVAREQDLLRRMHPPMLCVGALATPGVQAQTQAIDVGFTLYEEMAVVRTRLPDGRPPRVAVLGGATQSAAALHRGLIRGLLEHSTWDLALSRADRVSWELEQNPRVSAFDFSPQDYRACAAVVARPGLGTVHEAIAAGVPLICSYEPHQFEMTHIARRVAELGLGHDLGSSEDVGALQAALTDVVRPEARAAWARARARLPLDGVRQAARWLEGRLAAAA